MYNMHLSVCIAARFSQPVCIAHITNRSSRLRSLGCSLAASAMLLRLRNWKSGGPERRAEPRRRACATSPFLDVITPPRTRSTAWRGVQLQLGVNLLRLARSLEPVTSKLIDNELKQQPRHCRLLHIFIL